jgi:hypothetical protein
MNKQEKIFCGWGKEFGQYGDIKIYLNIDSIPDEFIFKKGEKMAVRLVLQEKRKPDEYGNTHYVVVDQWKPNKPEQTTDETPF